MMRALASHILLCVRVAGVAAEERVQELLREASGLQAQVHTVSPLTTPLLLHIVGIPKNGADVAGVGVLCRGPWMQRVVTLMCIIRYEQS